MKTITKPTYKCDFCNKLYQIKNRAEFHEKICKSNPENKRACYGCESLTKKLHVEEGEYYHNERTLLYCNHHKQWMHTPQSEIRDNVIETGEGNVLMPKECKNFIMDLPF